MFILALAEAPVAKNIILGSRWSTFQGQVLYSISPSSPSGYKGSEAGKIQEVEVLWASSLDHLWERRRHLALI
jgi:hypothetical protein